MIVLLLLNSIDITYTTTPQANKLIQNICENLHNKDHLPVDADQQWEFICKELFHSNNDNQYTTEQHDPTNGKHLNWIFSKI
jgi:hypothetical protein